MFLIHRTTTKRIIGFLLWLHMLAAGHAAAAATSFKVDSFNAHYIRPAENRTDWGIRKYAVLSILRDMDADLIAFQEMKTFEGGAFSFKNL